MNELAAVTGPPCPPLPKAPPPSSCPRPYHRSSLQVCLPPPFWYSPYLPDRPWRRRPSCHRPCTLTAGRPNPCRWQHSPSPCPPSWQRPSCQNRPRGCRRATSRTLPRHPWSPSCHLACPCLSRSPCP